MSEFENQTWRVRGATTIAVVPPAGIDPDKVPVKQLASTFGRGLDVNIENARLIAEAPAMYRFLMKHKDDPEVQEILSRIDGKEDAQ